MTARDEILDVAGYLAGMSSDGTFTIDQVVTEMRRRGTGSAESTIRTHVSSRLCANAPDNHPVVYPDFIRVDRGRYRFNI